MGFNQTYHSVGNVINIETMHGNLTLNAESNAGDFVAALDAVRERLDSISEIQAETREQLSEELKVDEAAVTQSKEAVSERLESVAKTLESMKDVGSKALEVGKTIASLAKWVLALAI